MVKLTVHDGGHDEVDPYFIERWLISFREFMVDDGCEVDTPHDHGYETVAYKHHLGEVIRDAYPTFSRVHPYDISTDADGFHSFMYSTVIGFTRGFFHTLERLIEAANSDEFHADGVPRLADLDMLAQFDIVERLFFDGLDILSRMRKDGVIASLEFCGENTPALYVDSDEFCRVWNVVLGSSAFSDRRHKNPQESQVTRMQTLVSQVRAVTDDRNYAQRMGAPKPDSDHPVYSGVEDIHVRELRSVPNTGGLLTRSGQARRALDRALRVPSRDDSPLTLV